MKCQYYEIDHEYGNIGLCSDKRDLKYDGIYGECEYNGDYSKCNRIDAIDLLCQGERKICGLKLYNFIRG